MILRSFQVHLTPKEFTLTIFVHKSEDHSVRREKSPKVTAKDAQKIAVSASQRLKP